MGGAVGVDLIKGYAGDGGLECIRILCVGVRNNAGGVLSIMQAHMGSYAAVRHAYCSFHVVDPPPPHCLMLANPHQTDGLSELLSEHASELQEQAEATEQLQQQVDALESATALTADDVRAVSSDLELLGIRVQEAVRSLQEAEGKLVQLGGKMEEAQGAVGQLRDEVAERDQEVMQHASSLVEVRAWLLCPFGSIGRVG